MADIFDSKILCNKCEAKMERRDLEKNGFVLRAMICPKCGSRLIHPVDESEYEKFMNLRNKEFKVKMRMVGNSYAVSIPMEIVSFIREQEKIMNDMVRLCFEESGRLSLNFEDNTKQGEQEEQGEKTNSRVIKAREVRIVRNGKPAFHAKQFYDSANPRNNKIIINKKSEKEREEREN